MARRSTINRIKELLDKFDPETEQAFIAAILSARDAVDVKALENALRAGDVARAVDLLDLPQGVLFPLDQKLMEAYAAGGAMVVEGGRKSGVIMGFDGRHPRAEAWARENVAGLIEYISREQRDAALPVIRDVIERQIIEGKAPRTAALDIAGRVDKATGRRLGGIVGLDAPRADRLNIVSDAMRSPEGVQSLVQGGQVRYKVNRATERRILRAYNAGTRVPEADRVLSLKQYGNQLLRERGETIARTEGINALRQGRREGFLQAIEEGHIPPDGIKRKWDATMDSRTRDDHQAMDGATVEGMQEPWVLPDGSRMMTPGDSSLGASAGQIINCRCVEVVQVDWIGNA